MTVFNKLTTPQMRKSSAERAAHRRRNIERVLSTPELRREYDAADDSGKTLMCLEKMLEAMAAPIRAERAEKIAAVAADSNRLRRCVEIAKREIEALSAELASFGFLRDSAPPMQVRKEVREAMAASLEKVEQSTARIAAALRDAGVAGVGEPAKAPFSTLTATPHEAVGFVSNLSSAWALPLTTQLQ